MMIVKKYLLVILILLSGVGTSNGGEREKSPNWQTQESSRKYIYPTNPYNVKAYDNPIILGALITSLLTEEDYKGAAIVSHLLIAYGVCDAYRTGLTNELLGGGFIPKILIESGLKVPESRGTEENINHSLPLERLLPEALGGDKKEILLRELNNLESNPNTIPRYLRSVGPPTYCPSYLFRPGCQGPTNPPISTDLAWAEAYGQLKRDLE